MAVMDVIISEASNIVGVSSTGEGSPAEIIITSSLKIKLYMKWNRRLMEDAAQLETCSLPRMNIFMCSCIQLNSKNLGSNLHLQPQAISTSLS